MQDDDGRRITLTSTKQRLLLSLLLVHANEVVAVDRLIDVLWNGNPPASARTNLQVYVHRLRSVLGQDRLAHRPPGYLLVVHPGELDADQAREHSAARQHHRALLLWRGEPYADVAEAEPLRRESDRLTQLRLDLIERRIQDDLACGRAAEVVAELTALQQQHPMRERFIELLLTALRHCGRTAEAIEVYHAFRLRLREELGIDPAAGIQSIFGELLHDGPAGAATVAPPATISARTAQPAQLPGDVVGFVGRSEQLAQLHDAADSQTLIAVVGVPGAGKTALAVRFGHQAADRYPDGTLFVNLRGYAADAPMSPVDALGRLLASLGVASRDIPTDLDNAAAMFRSRLSGRRMLVLLDNVSSADQVRPLLPAAPGCLTVVTSRDRLTGLVASHGGRVVVLGPLPSDEAQQLLTSMIGYRRTRLNAPAVTEMARLCGDLPLALRIAAANLVAHPQWPVTDYVATLRENRIAHLTVDGDIGVAGAFDLSYTRLPASARRLLRLLGRTPGDDITVDAAAALADTDPATTAALLDRLVNAHLLAAPRPGRFELHDLIRSYADRLAIREDGLQDCALAVHRLIEWYLARSDRAADLTGGAARLPARARPDARAPQPFASREEALTWLDGERVNIVAMVARAADDGPRPAAWLIADALRGYLMIRSSYADGSAIADNALRAALRDKDDHGQAVAYLIAGWVGYARLNYQRAVDAFDSAAAAAERAGWTDGTFAANNNLAAVMRVHGLPRQALPYLRTALRASSASGDSTTQVITANNLAGVLLELGMLREAEQCLRQAAALLADTTTSLAAGMNITWSYALWLLGRLDEAQTAAEGALATFRAEGDQEGQAHALKNLAGFHRRNGQLDLALTEAQAAQKIAQQVENPWLHGHVLNTLAAVHSATGDHRIAADVYAQAIVLGRDSRSGDVEGQALTGAADCYRILNLHDAATTTADAALAIAQQAGRRVQEAEALLVLAAIAVDYCEPSQAAKRAAEALALFTELDHPDGARRAASLLAQAESGAASASDRQRCE
ncbi:BTAD domain-containing putative transcriptional regulator [Hamadaea sp. NPDC050747]|uniref:AfsR/SARP family transcriptional regulator n=1 Tax=Hamadaea sp. NPDC050747 TaxID=3155789 RepID=UPI00340044BF